MDFGTVTRVTFLASLRLRSVCGEAAALFCSVCNGDPLKIDRGETDVIGIVIGDTDNAEEMDVVEFGPGEIESVETDPAEIDPVDIVDVTELD